MTRTFAFHVAIVFGLGLLAFSGCSDVPKGPPRFQIDPDKAAQEAMQMYDKNQDGSLDAKELEASPPLKEMLKNLKHTHPEHPDTLTASDISARLQEWNASPAVLLMRTGVTVLLDGKPLSKATVVYEPEPFLGPSYRIHQGQTNDYGGSSLDPEFPNFQGIYIGLYRVRISKKIDGKETIPEKYNTKTALGIEIASDVTDRNAGTFQLTSK